MKKNYTFSLNFFFFLLIQCYFYYSLSCVSYSRVIPTGFIVCVNIYPHTPSQKSHRGIRPPGSDTANQLYLHFCPYNIFFVTPPSIYIFFSHSFIHFFNFFIPGNYSLENIQQSSYIFNRDEDMFHLKYTSFKMYDKKI